MHIIITSSRSGHLMHATRFVHIHRDHVMYMSDKAYLYYIYAIYHHHQLRFYMLYAQINNVTLQSGYYLC